MWEYKDNIMDWPTKDLTRGPESDIDFPDSMIGARKALDNDAKRPRIPMRGFVTQKHNITNPNIIPGLLPNPTRLKERKVIPAPLIPKLLS